MIATDIAVAALIFYAMFCPVSFGKWARKIDHAFKGLMAKK